MNRSRPESCTQACNVIVWLKSAADTEFPQFQIVNTSINLVIIRHFQRQMRSQPVRFRYYRCSWYIDGCVCYSPPPSARLLHRTARRLGSCWMTVMLTVPLMVALWQAAARWALVSHIHPQTITLNPYGCSKSSGYMQSRPDRIMSLIWLIELLAVILFISVLRWQQQL